MSEVVVSPTKSQNGNLIFNVGLSQEDWAILAELHASRGWKLYSRILSDMKEGHQTAMLPLKDPNEVIKALGIVVGLNLSINQLGAMMSGLKQKQDRRVAEETKNQQ